MCFGLWVSMRDGCCSSRSRLLRRVRMYRVVVLCLILDGIVIFVFVFIV